MARLISFISICVIFIACMSYFANAQTTTTEAGEPAQAATTTKAGEADPGGDADLASTTTTAEEKTVPTTPELTTSVAPNPTTAQPPAVEATTSVSATTSATDSPTKTNNTTAAAGETTQNAVKPSSISHGFDAGSFVGGIALCAAVVAVTYFGCKMFRSKKPDYSTL